jgi:hypothetical protein
VAHERCPADLERCPSSHRCPLAAHARIVSAHARWSPLAPTLGRGFLRKHAWNAAFGIRARGYFVRVFKYSRRARLTARALLNSAATSASSRTRLGPPGNRSAYFPRTPPRKSYSGRSASRVRRPPVRPFAVPGLVVFFIILAFSTGREPSTDDSQFVAALGMSDNQQAVPLFSLRS